MINLHPAVTHFPVALVLTLLFCELWYCFRKKGALQQARSFLLAVILIGAAASVGTGLWYEETMPHPHEGIVHTVMERHETLGYVLLGAVVGLNILNYFFRNRIWRWKAYGVILAATAILATYQGYLGGELGHTHGLSLPEGEHPSMHLQEHHH